jgi:uncharacterized protein YbbC (DUF1343 family)
MLLELKQRNGIDALLADQKLLESLKGKRVGLVANQASC